MHDKILQIIPAPADMWVDFWNPSIEPDAPARAHERAICLALMEDRSGNRSVVAMVDGFLGDIMPARDRRHLAGLTMSDEIFRPIDGKLNATTSLDSRAEQPKHCVLATIVKNEAKNILCLESNCAWYDYEAKSCALLSIARSMREENPRK